MPLWRKILDSSHLAVPRAMIRVYVAPGELDGTIEFYEKLLGVDSDMYMSIPPDPADPGGGLTLAAVGGFLILEGSPERLAPFRATVGTLLVDDIEPYFARLTAHGAEIVHPPGERRCRVHGPPPRRQCYGVRASPPVGRRELAPCGDPAACRSGDC